jgi:hypothetical protein
MELGLVERRLIVPEAIMNNTSTLSLSIVERARGMESYAARSIFNQPMRATWAAEDRSLSPPSLETSRHQDDFCQETSAQEETK